MELLSTLGPSSLNEEVLKKLELLGVSLFRINLSHTEIKDLEKTIDLIRNHTNVPICIDTEGAQIRTRLKKKVKLEEGKTIDIFFDFKKNPNSINFYPNVSFNQFKIGDLVFIDFNAVVVEVLKIKKNTIQVIVINEGSILSNKGVSINKSIELNPFTKKDISAFKITRKKQIKNYALSFCNKMEDVSNMKKLVPKGAKIIAKIENKVGFSNCKEICKIADSILIDRGDLSKEFNIEDIPIIQKEITKIAKDEKTKIFVATNFLESMINNPFPNRAEINDIYNTLIDGVDGLVLAAETAVGKYPVESASIIKRIFKSFKTSFKNKKSSDTVYTIKKFDEIIIDKFAESDVKQIVFGTYKPLDRFMSLTEIKSVLNKNRLLDGNIWTLPIVLPINRKIKINKYYNILNSKKKILCSIKVDSLFEIDSKELLKKWFSTDYLNHPGIKSLKSRGKYFISGKITSPQFNNFTFQRFEVVPKKSKELIYTKGWHNIIGFHTRNIPHQGHIFIQKEAIKLSNADGLMLSPAVGLKKKGDFKNDFLIESYSEILRSKVHYKKAILCSLDIYSRYAGLREAVFTAICRKNLGCTHFIVGRDHTGFNNNFLNEDPRTFFSKIGDIGINIIFFDTLGFNKKNNKYSFNKNATSLISGSIIRNLIKKKKKIPDYLLNKDLQKIIKKWRKNFFYD
tara:strand:- start:1812 stop:3860 length:2049 start_codon:yes stop_codon:yes gene_type:complete